MNFLHAGIITVISFVLSVIFGFLILPVLRARKMGQRIREEGPSWHACKAGTPIMGGLCFIFSFLLVVGALLVYEAVREPWGLEMIPMALVVCYAVGNAMIGFADDYAKLVKKQNEGLTPLQKMILQVALTGGFVAMMAITGNLTTVVKIPFTDFEMDLGWFAYVLYMLVLVGFVNSTNLTDGLDGLASSVCAVVAAFGVVLSMYTDFYNADMTILMSALLGGVLGFLVYNRHPAKMFMGDTGSLFLGAVIMGSAVMCEQMPLFILAGMVFIIEMLSSLLQVVFFKLTKGKRLFKMAPLHHHFEKCGLGEVSIVVIFTAASVFFCLLAWWAFQF